MFTTVSRPLFSSCFSTNLSCLPPPNPPRILLAASYILVVYFLLYPPFLCSPLMATFFSSRVFSTFFFLPSFLLLTRGTCYIILSQYYRNFSLVILFDHHCLPLTISLEIDSELRTLILNRCPERQGEIVSLGSVLPIQLRIKNVRQNNLRSISTFTRARTSLKRSTVDTYGQELTILHFSTSPRPFG